MRVLLLILGTVSAALFLAHMTAGRRFDSHVENLDAGEYPLATLYIVGFSWSTTKLFAFRGKWAANLKAQAAVLFPLKYAEYYANVVWAQALTLVHLFATVTLLMAGLMYESATFVLIAGGFLTVLVGAYCLENMKNKTMERSQACEAQFPEVISTLAILVNSGMVLREAWMTISRNGTGGIYNLMEEAVVNMRNGYSDSDAIFLFGKASNSPEIRKFTSALLQSLEKGGGSLSAFLAQQSSELWNAKRQRMLQEGEKASAKLLGPIMLIFVGIIIIIVAAAFAGSVF